MIGMIIASLLLALLGVGYTGWHLATLAPLPLAWRWIIGLGWFALFVLIVLSFVFRSQSLLLALAIRWRRTGSSTSST